MPLRKYCLKDGSPVSGVTTVISGNLGWNTRPLMHWAWAEGKEGRDYRETRDRAADAGTLAHYLIDCDIKRREPEISGYPKEVLDKSYQAFFAYLEWKKRIRLKIFKTELSLVSEKFKYGLTPDCIAYIGEDLSILDYKAANGLYPDMLIQLAAYKQGWEENFPNKKLIGGCHLLRIDKENLSFHHHFWRDLPEAWDVFLNLLEIHKYQKVLKKLT